MIIWLSLNINLAFTSEKLQSRYSIQLNNTNQNLIRIRFGTIIGSPPFAFLDRSNRLSGLNVDLVRRICKHLSNIPNCEIQAIAAADANSALSTGTIDVLIGAIEPTLQNRSRFNFSKSYIQPSYFYIENRSSREMKKTGVIQNAFDNPTKQALGRGNEVSDFENYGELFDALSSKKLSSVIVPSYAAQFWLLSEAGKACCDHKGPINLMSSTTSIHRLATKRENAQLYALIENALHSLETSGSLSELRKRYLPLLAPTRN